MRNYSLETLKKQLAKAEENYYAEVRRGTGMQWGYCMRHSKVPSTARFSALQDRIRLLKQQIREKEQLEG